MNRPRLLLADDHAIVAEGLRLLLQDHCELLGILSDGPSLVDAAVQYKPDVIVADISMPGFDGLQAVRRMRERGVSAKIIMLTMYADPEVAEEAIAAGANGYVVKHSAGEELLKAIAAAQEGLTYITPFVYKQRPPR
jgi:DNA-binding NarL/FixJ family response regulator